MTTYRYDTGELRFEQDNTVLVLEDPAQQQHAFTGVDFLLTATLDTHSSVNGQAKASFKDIELTLTSSSGNMTASLASLYAEETTSPMISVLAFTGQFTTVTWSFPWPNPVDGAFYAMAWEISPVAGAGFFGDSFDDFFNEDLDAESSVTLVAEPVTAVMLLAGVGVLLCHRRNKTTT